MVLVGVIVLRNNLVGGVIGLTITVIAKTPKTKREKKMSNDIVTRLRQLGIDNPPTKEMFVTPDEAADEIELLRNDLASCKSDLNYWHERCTRAEACADIMHKQLNKKWWKR